MPTTLPIDSLAPAVDLVDHQVRLASSAAQLAFTAGDYLTALQAVERIPEHFRSADLRALYRRAGELRFAQQQTEAARRHAREERYDLAVLALEVVPEEDLDYDQRQLFREMEQLARIGKQLNTAREAVNHGEFQQAIDALECIPRGDWNAAVEEVFNLASSRAEQLRELRETVDLRLAEAREEHTQHAYVKAKSALEKWLKVQPQSLEALQLMREVRETIRLFSERSRLTTEATRLFETKDYEQAFRCLKQIDPEFLFGDAADLLELVVDCRERLHQLSATTSESFLRGEFQQFTQHLLDLDELLDNSPAWVVSRFTQPVLHHGLTRYAAQLAEGTADLDGLERLLAAWSQTEVVKFLMRRGDEFLPNYPPEGNVIPRILDELTTGLMRTPSHAPRYLPLLNSARQFLRETVGLLDRWNELNSSLESWAAVHNRRWTTWECWYETPAVWDLNAATKAVYQAAAALFPNPADRWSLLQQVAGRRLQTPYCIGRRALKKLARCCRRNRWRRSALTPFTPLGLLIGGLTFCGILLLSLALQVFVGIFFKLDGNAAYWVTVALLSLWSSFATAVYRVLSA